MLSSGLNRARPSPESPFRYHFQRKQSDGIYLDICHDIPYIFNFRPLSVPPMSQVAKLFTNGRSQAVRLPAAYRFDTKEVFIRQDPETGDVILSRKPATWDDFFAALKGADVPAGFLSEQERDQGPQDRDAFEGWTE
jgi:antitoxin VapB